ncbi:MAG: NAD(P)H-dependent oxidoreductase [Thermoguttaceae bacterium]|nr:NAD(P)H-dependent oxidoreductase [Thermoguttaceae bacterium]
MGKSLIIYFSRAGENYAVGCIDKGNTEIVAEFVRDLTGADMFKVEPAVPYADDYDTCVKEAKARIGRAPIKEKLADISAYDTIFVMSPIYWGTYAPEVETALEGLDFAGKTIRVVSTHEGSGLGRMVNDVQRLCPGAMVQKNGLAVQGCRAKQSKEIVARWLMTQDE